MTKRWNIGPLTVWASLPKIHVDSHVTGTSVVRTIDVGPEGDPLLTFQTRTPLLWRRGGVDWFGALTRTPFGEGYDFWTYSWSPRPVSDSLPPVSTRRGGISFIHPLSTPGGQSKCLD